ncbi:LacI family transcriptional regulator [Puniceicoccales bacterium CK1056]|uniref:LacI family transcriptional regulator n=1 Tax=Oceanipulchritudo coccoides TaxID=2706888 RepID=A0A6B2M2J9_9BACT|nr:LacI family DNA-binding transcriptional regulator [Oceanipulchritudo coccoides]NDV63241.1 LacI family transcriptional regulator [Oceanipulchritudo coccoides]
MNQKEIAERLGLSRTTVSRCFTNHPKINPETRARVFELAAEIGYAYSPPRNLTQKRPRAADSVAVVAGIPSNADRRVGTAREILAGISERLAAEKLTLNVNYVDPADFNLTPRARRILPGLRNANLLGFILLYPFREESVRNLISKFPTICVLNDFEEVDVDCVGVNQTLGIVRMVHHLVELGHRELGYLSWKYTVPTPWVERRFGAFVESLYRFHLPFHGDRVINVHREGQIEVPEVLQRAKKMISEGVTGIVCAADHQAYPLIKALREDGIRVPEDVSITGFDGEVPTEGLPQMTTIRTPFRDIGVSSVVSLLRRVTHPSAPRRHIMVAGRLIAGETTAPPRK